MLVDPVRHQRAGDPLLPPARRLHVVAPRARRVPVVADVVVVEDHRARQGREQPADVRVAPRLLVEPGVLLEVGDLRDTAARSVSRAAAMNARDRGRGARRRRPGRRAGTGASGHCLGRPRRHPVGAYASRTSGSPAPVGPRRRPRTLAARSEQDADRAGSGRWSGSGSADTASRPAARPARRRAGPRTASHDAGVEAVERRRSRSGGRRRRTSCPDARGATPARTSTSHGASVSTQMVASSVPTWRSRGPRISSAMGQRVLRGCRAARIVVLLALIYGASTRDEVAGPARRACRLEPPWLRLE